MHLVGSWHGGVGGRQTFACRVFSNARKLADRRCRVARHAKADKNHGGETDEHPNLGRADFALDMHVM